MIFNLQELKNQKTVIITNENEVFADTPLANDSFSIEIDRISKEETTNIMYGCLTDDGNINQGSHSKKTFIASIVAVNGFVDENNQPIEISDGIREIIFEYGDESLRTEIFNAISSFKKNDEKKSESQEDDLEPTQIGA